MAKKHYDDEYDYEEASKAKGNRSATLFMGILGTLLLVLTVLCAVLTGRLRTADKNIEDLNTQLTEARNVQWEVPVSTTAAPNTDVETEIVPIPGNSTSQVIVASTPAPTATPVPTATPAPVVVTAGGLPSWLTEDNMKRVTKRPKADEWYGQPGKLYVTASLGLNMRSGPDASYALITTVKPGSEVMIYAASGNWRFVQDPNGNFGWVSNNMLSNEPPLGVPVTSFAPTTTATPTPVSDENLPIAEAPVFTG